MVNFYESEQKTFSQLRDDLNDKIKNFKTETKNYPLLVLIYLWMSEVDESKALGKKYHEIMEQLLVHDLISYEYSRKKTLISVEEFAKLSPTSIVDEIRCFSMWSIDKREDYVQFYCEFSSWLSEQTFGLIPVAIDHDRQVTQQRKMPFETYVKFISALNLRWRIMAKIFYLGGSVRLNDVLSLKVEDINFRNSTIAIRVDPIKFPLHAMEDLRTLIGKRKKGYIFQGRKNDRINHSIPYRALKVVASKLGMSSDTTFKEFVKNK